MGRELTEMEQLSPLLSKIWDFLFRRELLDYFKVNDTVIDVISTIKSGRAMWKWEWMQISMPGIAAVIFLLHFQKFRKKVKQPLFLQIGFLELED